MIIENLIIDKSRCSRSMKCYCLQHSLSPHLFMT